VGISYQHARVWQTLIYKGSSFYPRRNIAFGEQSLVTERNCDSGNAKLFCDASRRRQPFSGPELSTQNHLPNNLENLQLKRPFVCPINRNYQFHRLSLNLSVIAEI
jgi:hypothetical protein